MKFNIFDHPCDYKEASVVLMPVEWEATVSYGEGTANAPAEILKASQQVDLYDIETKEAYKTGFYWVAEHSVAASLGKEARIAALDYLETENSESVQKANELSNRLNEHIYMRTWEILKDNKIPGLVGGDHSCPYGLIKAISEHHGSPYGILHIDAHADLRQSYQGFEHSHASIMNNVLKLETPPTPLVQVGIRDFCKE